MGSYERSESAEGFSRNGQKPYGKVYSGYALPRAERPEDEGVPSKALLELMEDFEAAGQDIHSLIAVRHGKVVYEAYRYPYAPDIPHSVNSFSKSIASTAAGFAISEGLFSLEDKIYDYFPEYKGKIKKQGLKYADILTIKHILTMSTGKFINVAKDKTKLNWISDFLSAKFIRKPGEIFHYTNENAYMLCVLIRRLTGLTVTEYLRPRLFEPLGIEPPHWETDAEGTESGGWGVYLKPEDGAKIALCYLNNGVFNGRQVIPEFWTREATIAQMGNPNNYKRDSKAGYGYQFWMCHIPNTYAGRGQFGQQGVVLKDYDAVFFYTSAHPDEQLPMDVLFRHFPKAFGDAPLSRDDEAYEKLNEFTRNLIFLPAPKKSSRSELEKKLNESSINFPKQRFLSLAGMPTSVLPLYITYVSTDKWAHVTDFTFNFEGGELSVRWAENGVYNQIPVGLDGKFRFGRITLPPFDFTTASYGYWEKDDSFVLKIIPIESVATRTFIFTFKGDRVKIEQDTTPSAKGMCDNIAILSKQWINNDFLHFFATILLKLAPRVLQPKMRSRLKTRRGRPNTEPRPESEKPL